MSYLYVLTFSLAFILWTQQWDSDLVEAKYIKDLADNLSIIRLRFGESSKPLFKNREFIVYERRETMDDGTLVTSLYHLIICSLPNHILFTLLEKMSHWFAGGSGSFTAKRDSCWIASEAK